MPSSHLILCRPLVLLPPIFPSIRVFSNEPALCMRWPKYWSFSFSISPANEHPGLISFRMDWLDLLAVQGTLKSLLQHHSSKASILWRSAFFLVQPSHPYMTTGKTIALTRRTFVGKVMSLLFNILSRLVIIFLLRSKRLFISLLKSPSTVILELPFNWCYLDRLFNLMAWAIRRVWGTCLHQGPGLVWFCVLVLICFRNRWADILHVEVSPPLYYQLISPLWFSWTLESRVSPLEENKPSLDQSLSLERFPTRQECTWKPPRNSAESLPQTFQTLRPHQKAFMLLHLNLLLLTARWQSANTWQIQEGPWTRRCICEPSTDKPPWVMEIYPSPASTPSPEEGLLNLYSDHVVYLLKTLQNLLPVETS